MKYTRTDLCPTCNTRLDITDREWHPATVVDYPMILHYKGEYYTTIYCNGCRGLWTKKEIQEYWISTYKEHFNG